MKTKLIFFDIEFTSLSPDAQIISLGVISDCGKSFYAEFTDFDISRCDDWVKENVLLKLNYSNQKFEISDLENTTIVGDTANIAANLRQWLSQFSDYKIQFVVDCGTLDWYWLLQLLAEWEQKEDEMNGFKCYCPTCGAKGKPFFEIGLPKLHSNVSPVPMDLNDLIAFKKGISVSEAFDLNREELAFGWYKNAERNIINKFKEDELAFFGFKGESKDQKHNALWDAKVIKAIYEQLNS